MTTLNKEALYGVHRLSVFPIRIADSYSRPAIGKRTVRLAPWLERLKGPRSSVSPYKMGGPCLGSAILT